MLAGNLLGLPIPLKEIDLLCLNAMNVFKQYLNSALSKHRCLAQLGFKELEDLCPKVGITRFRLFCQSLHRSINLPT